MKHGHTEDEKNAMASEAAAEITKYFEGCVVCATGFVELMFVGFLMALHEDNIEEVCATLDSVSKNVRATYDDNKRTGSLH